MTNNVTKITFAGFATEFYALMWDMRWLMLLALVLIVSDLWYGIGKARRRGEEVRTSRAIRRTLVKGADYVCVVLVGAVLGRAIGVPLGVDVGTVAVCCMALACYCELESVVGNFCECKGLHYHVSLWSLVRRLAGLRSRVLEDVADAIGRSAASDSPSGRAAASGSPADGPLSGSCSPADAARTETKGTECPVRSKGGTEP